MWYTGVPTVLKGLSTGLMIALEKSIYLSDYNQFLYKKRFEVDKKQIFLVKKIRNSGNCIYDYVHTFFGEDFKSNAL